jgi:hypothetical protein
VKKSTKSTKLIEQQEENRGDYLLGLKGIEIHISEGFDGQLKWGSPRERERDQWSGGGRNNSF